MDEIKLRMELLMEIYEQMLSECDKLQNMHEINERYEQMQSK